MLESTLASLISLGIIIVSATIMTYIFNRLKQPSVLAFILTGIIIGPMVLGLVGNTEEIKLLSEIGIAFLLFSVGVGTDIKEIKQINLSVFLVPVINIVISFLLFLLFKNVFLVDLVQALYLSFIVSFSSTMLVVKLFMDNLQLNSLHGKLSVGILLAEDLLAVLAIPILKNISSFSLLFLGGVILKTIVFILFAYFLYKVVYPNLIKKSYRSEQSFFLLSIASCFIFILLSIKLDFPIAIGAFFGGLAISIYPYNLEISNKISGIRNLLSMIFFVSLGMQLSFNISSNIYFFVGLLILVFLIKPLIHFFMILFSGYGLKISSQVALNLAQISEFSLILAMQGFNLAQITSAQYNAVIIVTSLSMLLTPYIMKSNKLVSDIFKPFAKHYKSKHFSRKIDALKNIPKNLSDHIVIVGSDVIGEAVVKVLGRDVEIPLMIVDFNPDKILHLISKNINCICGDINSEDIISSLALNKAKLIVTTLPRFDDTIRFVNIVKSKNPNLKIYSRAKTKSQAVKLYQIGVDLVILPSVLESNYLLDKIYNFIRYGSESVSSLKSAYLSYLEKDVKSNKEFLKKRKNKF